MLAPGGRVAVFDTFVADRERPSFVCRASNVVARVVATELIRELRSCFHAGGTTAVHDEPAGPGGLFQVVLARPDQDAQGRDPMPDQLASRHPPRSGVRERFRPVLTESLNGPGVQRSAQTHAILP